MSEQPVHIVAEFLAAWFVGLRYALYDGKIGICTNARATQVWWFGPTGDEW